MARTGPGAARRSQQGPKRDQERPRRDQERPRKNPVGARRDQLTRRTSSELTLRKYKHAHKRAHLGNTLNKSA